MALLLYLATAAALLWLARRWLMPLGRGEILLLLLLPLCFTGAALLTGRIFGPFDLAWVTEPLKQMRVPLGVPRPRNGSLNDVFTQVIPWRHALQKALAHGEWPLWNRFILSGTLLGASAQPAVYSPFTLLACLLPIGDSMTFSAAITFFIAALGAYLFARDIGCRPAAAAIGAAAWMASGPMAFFVLWSHGGAWALFPFVLLATRRCVWQPGVRGAALLTTALTLLLLAGHPESALHVVFLGAIYGLFELARCRIRVVAVVASALGAGGVALLLCAVYLLPIIDEAPQAMEYRFRMDLWRNLPHGVSGTASLARVLTDIFPFLDGARWTLGGVGDVPLDTAAVGSIALVLAIYALLRARRAETWFFAGVALFGIAARAGWPPVVEGLRRLPLFGATLVERFAYAAACALAILAAIAVEELFRRRGDRALLFTFASALAAVAGGTLLLRHSGWLSPSPFPEWGRYAEFAEVGLLGAAALALATMRSPRAVAPALLLLLLGQRYLAAGDIYPTLQRQVAFPPIPILETLKNIRTPFRIVGQGYSFIPGMSAMYGLEDVRGYEALTLSRYRATYDLWCVHQPVWFNRVDDLSRPFLSFLNVRYAIAPTAIAVPPGWHVVAEQPGTRLLENERVLARAFVPGWLFVGRDAMIDRTLSSMQQTDDFGRFAWIDAPMPLHERDNAVGAVSIARIRYGFTLDATMRRGGWVVVSEPAWKGWRAYIDGRRVEMQIANLAFLGIYVPAGRHTVRLVYMPESFVRGRAISVVTLLGLIVCGFVRERRARAPAATGS